MKREQDPRIAKAFIAMKNIGIGQEKVKPVLRELLKLYDNKWELIEDDNYRTLADAIFEYENEQKHEKNDASTNANIELPCKEPNKALPENKASCIMDNANIGMSELPKRLEGQKLSERSAPLRRDHTAEPSSSRSDRDRRKSPTRVFSQVIGGNYNESDTLQRNQSSREFRDHENGRKRTREEPLDHTAEPSSSRSDRDRRKSPTRVSSQVTGGNRNESDPLQRNQSSGEFRDHENGRKRTREEPLDCIPYSALPSTCLSKGKYLEANGQASDSGTTFHCTSDVASSKCGQARMSLSCKYASGKSDFRSPNLDAVFKYVEGNLLKSYKIISPKFSVVELLRYMCDCYIELSTDSGRRSMVNRASGNCYPRLTDSNKKRSMTDLNNPKNAAGSSSSNAPSRSVVQRQPVNHNGRRAVHNFFDITKGTENVKIMLLDKLGKESLPDFMYIPENTVYESAQIHVSLARIVDDDCCSSCSGDCLSSSIPCECARDTGGEFAYTPEGLLTEDFLKTCISMGLEPDKHYQVYCADCPLERAKHVRRPEKCKGHLLRKFIKECWRKCGCSMLCGNRVVQRGITRNLQVFLAEEGKGWGLRTVEEIPEGAFICQYVGEILTNMELYERNQINSGKGRHTYPLLLDADWGSEGVLKDEEALCLDATYYGNVARFINHRCYDANLLDIPVEVETPDHHYYHLAFFTKRKIDAFEELTWDYKIDFNDHNHPIKAFQCCCKSPCCRDKKGKRAQE